LKRLHLLLTTREEPEKIKKTRNLTSVSNTNILETYFKTFVRL